MIFLSIKTRTHSYIYIILTIDTSRDIIGKWTVNVPGKCNKFLFNVRKDQRSALVLRNFWHLVVLQIPTMRAN